jgi:hypothetical protein
LKLLIKEGLIELNIVESNLTTKEIGLELLTGEVLDEHP